jgi:two-component system, NarL family, nitrate/nitrite response regulator NarL
MTTIGIFIADDHDILVESLIGLLSGQNPHNLDERVEDLPLAQQVSQQYRLAFKGRARNAEELFQRLPNMIKFVDLILLDISFPDKKTYEGLDIGRKLIVRFPKLKVVFLTQMNEKGAIEEARAMGANGYISKDFGRRELSEAIFAVFQSNDFVLKVPPGTADLLKQDKIELSELETQILNYTLAEWTAAEIAVQLDMGQPNVERYLRNLRAKLKVESAAGLGREAMRLNLAPNWEQYLRKK